MDELRFELLALSEDQGASEILIFSANEQLIVSTTYGQSIINYFEDSQRNIITSFFPQMTKLDQGYFTDIYIETDTASGFRVVIYYSLETVFGTYLFIVKLLAWILGGGLILVILIGFSRTEQMLRPISEVTKTAKQINGDNLNLRIGDQGAQFELCELIDTINQMMDRIQASYDKQKRFVSDVSHELRTPIAVISGYGSMLNRWGKKDPEVLDESIEAIINEAKNMNDLVEKLLFLARHDNDNITYEIASVNVSELCADVIKETILVHTDFTVNLDIRKDVIAQIDEMRIKQLFRILIDNAIKYSSDRKEIDLSLTKDSSEFIFKVKDYGVGISKENLPNIFDRFFRTDSSRTKTTGGYGLGLAIAKIIVLGHKGKIHVKSKIKEGTEISVHIPLTNAK